MGPGDSQNAAKSLFPVFNLVQVWLDRYQAMVLGHALCRETLGEGDQGLLVRSCRSLIKFYDEITKVGELVPGKPALRAHLLCLSKDTPVKCCANRVQSAHAQADWKPWEHKLGDPMLQLINLTMTFSLIPVNPWRVKLERCVMQRVTLLPLGFILLFKYLWLATVRNWAGVVFGPDLCICFFFWLAQHMWLCGG